MHDYLKEVAKVTGESKETLLSKAFGLYRNRRINHAVHEILKQVDDWNWRKHRQGVLYVRLDKYTKDEQTEAMAMGLSSISHDPNVEYHRKENLLIIFDNRMQH